jgi:polar amino acid transport system substrate-binding protein
VARRNKLTRLVLIPAVALALAAAGCAEEVGNSGNSQAGEKPTLVKGDKLVTCTHLPYEPFQFKKGGEIVGFDVDLVDLVAKELGVEQEIFDTAFEGIESAAVFERDDCDLAAAAMTITDERKKVMDFSVGYFDANQALLVKKGSGIKSLDDLKGKVLGVQQATTGEIYAEDHKSEFGYQTKQFEDLALLLQSVQNGQIDAAINDNTVLYDFLAKNDDVEVTEELETGEQYGIGVKKGNKALLAVVNKVIEQAKKDGTYDKLYKKWFPEAGQAEN